MRRLLAAVLAFAFGLALAAGAAAHEVRPAYLEIRQDGPQHFTVTWKQPVVGEMAVRLVPHLSNGWLAGRPTEQFATPAFLIRSWSVDAAPAALIGSTLRVEGLERTITDALVSVRLADGRAFETVLKPHAPSLRVDFEHRRSHAVPAYFRLGVEHILGGVDHLMFVLGLLLLVGVRRRLVEAITAFTLAHSLTLAATAIGWVHVPSAVIEALVALSIVFVAAELIAHRRGQGGLASRHPGLIAGVFGLLHGFAFAGALAEVGLPQDAIPMSLLLFNLGVEAGQLLFVAVCVLAMLALGRLRARLPAGWPARWDALRYVPPYAIGGFASFWFIERTVAAFA
ncbi:HupE/UreJ family protein [Phenylobacterium sp. LjRoot219]|uniref:HupE/UreJ family protein n=1 Tax=Phenylobacterium sp. LjRoot219 TaxID=3342283 RepID=UPI003ECEADAC